MMSPSVWLLVIHAVITICSGYLVSEPCRSIDYYGDPWLPIDVCTNSYTTRYQGTYSEKYVCNEAGDAVNVTAYWGHGCLGHSFLNDVLIESGIQTYCYNATYSWEDWCSYYGDESHGCPATTTSSPWTWNWNTTHAWKSTTTTTTTTTTLSPSVTLDNRSIVMLECYNWTYDGLINLNCDVAKECPYVNYTYLDPLPEERDCTEVKSEANWHTELHVVGQCDCYDYNSSVWWNYGGENKTVCTNYLCDEEGIWYVYNDYVNTSLPRKEWCVSNIDDVNATEYGADIYLYLEIPAGCDKDSGQFMEVDYCPDDSQAINILKYSLSVSIVIVITLLLH